jgi:drug/metabolite transporter (DMT)-like permease
LILTPIALTRHRAEFAKVSRRDLIVAAGIGVVLALHFATWIESLFHTSVASSVIIVSTEALFAALGAAVFLRERLKGREYLLILDVVTPSYGSLAEAGVTPAMVRVSVGPAPLPTPEPFLR